MIKGGKGGSKTKIGLAFEEKTDIEKLLSQQPYYKLAWKQFTRLKNKYSLLLVENKPQAYLLKKHRLYYFLEEFYQINWKDYLSKQIMPDNALYVLNTLYIIEIKFQSVAGSVDEKLQTCDFKRKTYQHLVCSLNWNVEYIYILNDWFKQPMYKNTLDYILAVGCRYYFNYLPLTEIGLKN